jgi:hypothetical protein
MWIRTISAVAAIATILGATVASAQSTSELLEKGIYTEETVGDLDAAIEIYQRIVAQSQANRGFVARAQFRLGQCLMKKGKKAEAQKVFQQLVDQFQDSPDQKVLVEKARKQLPGKPELQLDPVPWVDGEHLEMRIKLGTGLEIGDFVFSANKRKIDGQDVWYLKLARDILANAPNLGLSQVVAEIPSFRPIRSSFRHSLLGTVEADYGARQVTVRTKGDDGQDKVRKDQLDGVHYDNEQGWFVFRRMPLAEGYSGKLPVYASFGGGAIELGVKVTAKETVETPAGRFECFKLFVTPVQQSFWISADEHRYVVKFEAGGVTGVLQCIRQVKPGDTIQMDDDKLGFSLTAPADWFFMPQQSASDESERVFILVDPQADAVTAMHVRPLENLEDPQRASVRAWAESRLGTAAEENKDFKVRPDSWQERKVGGLPAISCIADFTVHEKQRTQYRVFVLGESTATSFSAHTEPDRLDDFRKSFDPIIDSYKED